MCRQTYYPQYYTISSYSITSYRFEKKSKSGLTRGAAAAAAAVLVMAAFFLIPGSLLTILMVPIPMLSSAVDVVAWYFFGLLLLVFVPALFPALPEDNDVDGTDDDDDHMLFLALSTAPWPGCWCLRGVSLA